MPTGHVKVEKLNPLQGSKSSRWGWRWRSSWRWRWRGPCAGHGHRLRTSPNGKITSASQILSTSVFPGRGGVKNMCDLALKETCQPFNLLSKVDIDVISRTEHFRSIEGAQCLFSVIMVVLWWVIRKETRKEREWCGTKTECLKRWRWLETNV